MIIAKRSATINAMLIIWYLFLMERLSIAWDVCTGLMSMNYNDYENWFQWSNIGAYICQVCGQEVRGTGRMRHIGRHLRDGEKKC